MWEPEDLKEYIFPEDKNALLAVEEVIKVAKGEKGYNRFISHGPRGTGKTTLTKLLANITDMIYYKINASKDRGIDTIRDTVSTILTSASEKPVLLVLDEAENLTDDAQKALKALMDDMLPDKVLWLLTNNLYCLIHEIRSRTIKISFSQFDDEEVCKRFSKIFNQDLDEVRRIWGRVRPDIRSLCRALELGSEEEPDEATDQALVLLEKYKEIGDWKKFVVECWNDDLDFQGILISLFKRVPPEVGLRISESLFRVVSDPRGRRVHFFSGLYLALKELGLVRDGS